MQPLKNLALASLRVALLLVALCQPAMGAKPVPRNLESQSIKVVFTPLSGFDKTNTSKRRFGVLDWIGGGVLTSPSKFFGGWSGLAFAKRGAELMSVSDAGVWMTAKLDYERGRISGVSNARIGPLRQLDGRTLRRDRDRDAEAIALTSGNIENGRALVAFEQNHRIGLFNIGKRRFSKPRRYLKIPKAARRMRALKGFEAMAPLQGRNKGTLLAISERRLDRRGNHRGWLLKGNQSKAIRIENIGGFDITDAAALADGGVVLLERRFRWLEGIKMRLRYIKADALMSGSLIKGQILMAANLGQQIDNMEGLAVHRGESGETILTLISDDNFNQLLQRTVLLQFAWRRAPRSVGN